MVTILGSTGSIGLSTLDVIRSNPGSFSVYALTAKTQIDLLFNQCLEFSPKYAVVLDDELAQNLQKKLCQAALDTHVLCGVTALEQVSSAAEVDTVVAAIVGAAGLMPTYKAVCAAKRILLANKEALVMSGRIFMDAVCKYGAELLPVDSEHNAIFQCLPPGYGNVSHAGVRRVLLTGSGGPFRETPMSALSDVTPDQACAHPNWSMGRKISVDSATMMNKGLEYIEACWLFDVQPSQVEVVVHPQSIVHSMVEYIDGSVIAQMGNPDMRTPIAHCLGWPKRIESNVKPLDFFAMSSLDFEKPDYDRFPCLRLAIQAMERRGAYPAALNAANEVAVDSFLQGNIGFVDIALVNGNVFETIEAQEPQTIEDVLFVDSCAREIARNYIKRIGGA